MNKIFYNKKLLIYKLVDKHNQLLDEKVKELNCHGK